MKYLLLLLIAIISMASCSTPPEPATSTFRSQELFRSVITKELVPYSHIDVKQFNASFKVGDTILVQGTYYVLLSKED